LRAGLLQLVGSSLLVVLVGCNIQEINIVDVEDVVIAEIYIDLAEDPAENEIRALLHRTVGGPRSGANELHDARIVVSRSDGLTLELIADEFGACLESLPTVESGTCFLADPSEVPNLRPGDLMNVVVTLADGGTLLGGTRVPSSFQINGVSTECRLDPNTLMPVLWSSSEGAWAYVSETSIQGLPEALELEGIPVDKDPLNLLGLSVSDQDTTIVFPSEFGLFERFDLDADLSVRLQSGLPPSTAAEVSITAVEGNFVNWARRGNFNPSGQVRVPSLRGDGTGVFGATVNRRFVVISAALAGAVPDCRVSDPQ
jgi:hypothetical protein